MARRFKKCRCRCLRRGPVDAHCPDIAEVIVEAQNCKDGERTAKDGIPRRCWRNGATYGHCRCAEIK